MNINIDNYEAYLVDYLDGKLSEDESMLLKQFVTMQGLDFDELVQGLPSLEPQPIEYERKESLKKKATVLPLYIKVASAAAVIALLFGLFLNRHEPSPQDQPMAENEPELIQPIENVLETQATEVPETSPIIETPKAANPQKKAIDSKARPAETKPIEMEATHDFCPLMAALDPIPANEIQFSDEFMAENGMLPQLPIYPIYFEENVAQNGYDLFESEPSLIGRGILWASKGKCDDLGDLIQLGLHRATHDVIHYTAKAALTAYYTIDYRIEESKERLKGEPKE